MKAAFPLQNSDAIRPLEVVVRRSVRFEEIDPMGIMWHGHYASWLEDGREALGREYAISYLDFYRREVMTPVKRYTVDYCRPLLYNTVYTIHTFLAWNESAKMEYRYLIKDSSGSIMTKAHTVHLFIDTKGALLLDVPEFYGHFLSKWKNGELF